MTDETGLCPKCESPLVADAPAGLCPRCLVLAGFDSDVSSPAASNAGRLSATGSGQTFEPPAPEEIAPWFPDLEILELIGHGGMGAVYKARQPKLDRIVALKIIRPESAQAPTFAERFTREARTLARLNHPHVVALHDFGDVTRSETPDAQPLYYFIMEYVDGASLRELLRDGPIDADQTLAIVPQICDALQFAHDEGVVHRDIKPENILIDKRGRVRIADFGLARLLVSTPDDLTLTATHQVMGTPLYMAPEQMTGSHAVDHRADLYSLGVVLYEMLTGELPMGQFDPPSSRVGVDVRFDDIVSQSLAREPERRFQQASEIKTSAEAISPIATRGEPMQPARPQAFSSIANREVVNVLRWVVSDTEDPKQPKPDMPAGAVIAMCALGCLLVLLPWFHVEIGQNTRIDGRPVQLAESLSIPIYASTHDVGIFPPIIFGVCGLLVIMTPARQRTAVWLSALLLFLAVAALTTTFVFRSLLNTLSLPHVAAMTAPGVEGDPSPSMFKSNLRIGNVSHRLEFREGFYGSVSLSVVLLLLSAVGIRNAITHRLENNETTGSVARTARNTFDADATATGDGEPDLVDVRSELDGPSLALIVVGALMAAGNVAWMAALLDGGPTSADYGLMLIPGIVVGIVMFIGGVFMRGLKSRGWAMIGTIAGFLPVSPAWILTALTSTAAMNVLSKPHIRQAFIDQERERLARRRSS